MEERLQFTRSDEVRDDRTEVGDARTAKRLEREREDVRRLTIPWVCVFPVSRVPDEEAE